MIDTIEIEAYPQTKEEMDIILQSEKWQGLRIKNIEILPPTNDITIVKITVYSS